MFRRYEQKGGDSVCTVAKTLYTKHSKILIGGAASASASAAAEAAAAASGHLSAAAVGASPSGAPTSVSPRARGHVVAPASVAPTGVVTAGPAAAGTTPHTASHASPAVRLDCHLLDLHFLALDVDRGLLEQLVGRLLLLVGHEAEVLGLVVFAPVDRPLDLDDGAELGEVFPDVVLGDVVLELSDVDLALLGSGLLDGDLLPLDDVLLSKNFVQGFNILEDDESEPPGK